MVRIKGLGYQYTGAQPVQYPDWEVAQGDHSLILGGSGCGKTTLLHLLAGLLKSQQGELLVAGTSLPQLGGAKLDSFRGKNIGLIFQKSHLINTLSVKDNLKLAQYLAHLPQDQSRINQVLSALDISGKANAKVYELSQGQQQRVAIARAVLNKPKVVMADEPTASLDDKNAFGVLDILEQQASDNQASLIIATHDQRIKDRIKTQLTL
ncbi:MAG: ATP-binding cassette domain-containing protein [Cyclobacteriaceae bacterium]